MPAAERCLHTDEGRPFAGRHVGDRITDPLPGIPHHSLFRTIRTYMDDAVEDGIMHLERTGDPIDTIHLAREGDVLFPLHTIDAAGRGIPISDARKSAHPRTAHITDA